MDTGIIPGKLRPGINRGYKVKLRGVFNRDIKKSLELLFATVQKSYDVNRN